MTHPSQERSANGVEVAFITVNYNTLEWIKRLQDFFGRLDVPFTFSFTVVDNDSSDGSQEFLQSHPEIHYLQTGENLGYGRAVNRGVTAKSSKYVCVTNTDVILNREALIALWRFLEERQEVGVCAPRITYEDGRAQGMVFERSLLSQYFHWYGKLSARKAKRRVAKTTAPVRVDGVMGAFFFIRRSVIPQPTLFDEDFFFFHEDTAFAHTLKNLHVPCFVLPEVSIIHVGGQSRSEATVPQFYESKYLYLRKFYGSFHANAISLIDRMRILRKWFLYSLCSLVSASEQIRSKQRHYRMAWNYVRMR